MFDGAVDVVQKNQRGVRADVIEECFRFVKEERQVVFYAGGGNAVFNIFVKRYFARITFKGFAPTGAEGRPRLFVHRKFMGRKQSNLINFFYGSLIVRIEHSDLVEFIVKKVESIRLGRAHREEVKQAAAAGKLSGCDHLRNMLVASGH